VGLHLDRTKIGRWVGESRTADGSAKHFDRGGGRKTYDTLRMDSCKHWHRCSDMCCATWGVSNTDALTRAFLVSYNP
jgi:hypothetical protein